MSDSIENVSNVVSTTLAGASIVHFLSYGEKKLMANHYEAKLAFVLKDNAAHKIEVILGMPGYNKIQSSLTAKIVEFINFNLLNGRRIDSFMSEIRYFKTQLRNRLIDNGYVYNMLEKYCPNDLAMHARAASISYYWHESFFDMAYLTDNLVKKSKALPIAISTAIAAGIAYWLGHRDGE